jgi:hypothetical protein
MPDLYQQHVTALISSLAVDTERAAARMQLRRFLDRIVIPPAGLLDLVGNPAAMLTPGALVGCGGLHPTRPPIEFRRAA